MRLKNYITEEKQVDIVKLIKKDCGPWLRTINPIINSGKGFVRYSFKERIKFIKNFFPRTDREPRDNSQELHNTFDKGFLEKFGWKGRSEGVFVWPVNNIAAFLLDSLDGDSHTFIFYPIGEFKYIWSPKVKDLFNVSRGAIETPEDFIKTYINKNLLKSIKGPLNTGNEVMFKCSSYYLVNMKHMALLMENGIL
jgi:hypothetical protein